MKFSVLMSLYYKENPLFLKQSIDSIISQTLKPDEIVLVEDGPLTSALEAVVKDYTKRLNNLIVVRLKHKWVRHGIK